MTDVQRLRAAGFVPADGGWRAEIDPWGGAGEPAAAYAIAERVNPEHGWELTLYAAGGRALIAFAFDSVVYMTRAAGALRDCGWVRVPAAEIAPGAKAENPPTGG